MHLEWVIWLILAFLGALAATYWLGRRFFGQMPMLLTVLVMLSALFIPGTAKWATSGQPSWALLVVSALSMLAYLKQPRLPWLLLVWGSWIPALLLSPIGALAALLSMAVVWRFRHPDGKRLDGLYLWILGPLLALVSWRLEWFPSAWDASAYGMQLLSLFPWWGFLAAALVHLLRRKSSGEEMSILLGGLLVGGLLSGAPFLQWVLALLIAKQLQRIFEPGYPYGVLVNTIQVLHLIFFLLAGILGLIYAYYELGGPGFRMGMSMIMAYWIPAFFGVVGLYSRSTRMVATSSSLGALLLSLAFWAHAADFPALLTLLRR